MDTNRRNRWRDFAVTSDRQHLRIPTHAHTPSKNTHARIYSHTHTYRERERENPRHARKWRNASKHSSTAASDAHLPGALAGIILCHILGRLCGVSSRCKCNRIPACHGLLDAGLLNSLLLVTCVMGSSFRSGLVSALLLRAGVLILPVLALLVTVGLVGLRLVTLRLVTLRLVALGFVALSLIAFILVTGRRSVGSVLLGAGEMRQPGRGNMSAADGARASTRIHDSDAQQAGTCSTGSWAGTDGPKRLSSVSSASSASAEPYK